MLEILAASGTARSKVRHKSPPCISRAGHYWRHLYAARVNNESGRVINLFTGAGVPRESINIAAHFPSPRKAQTKSRTTIGQTRKPHPGHGKCMQTDGLNILPRNGHRASAARISSEKIYTRRDFSTSGANADSQYLRNVSSRRREGVRI